MGRRKENPEKAALRKVMDPYLKDNIADIKDGSDVNSIVKNIISIIVESVLDEELNEELGYTKYDYKNKDTDNSRNGHSKKIILQATGIWKWKFPVIGTGI